MARVVDLLALLALALGLSACSGAPTADPVAQAATKTRDAGSSRVELTTTVASAGRRMTFAGKGVLDYRRDRGTLSFDFSQLAGGRVEMRYDAKVLYVRMPQLRTMLPHGKSWLKVDVEALARGAGLGTLDQVRGQDPAQLLDYLHSLDAKPTDVGRERVRGVDTTHYRARVSLEKALDEGLKRLPEAKRRAAERELRTMMESIGAETMPVDAWIDGDGRVRRVKTTYSLRLPAGQVATTSIATVVDFFDFGARVAVKAPPAAATFDVTRLIPAPATG